MSNYLEHIEKYQSELENDPNLILPLIMLGRIAVKELRVLDALKFYERVLLAEPENVEAMYVIAAIYLNKGSKEVALDCFERLTAKNINSRFICEYKAMLDTQNKEQHLSDAVKFYKESDLTTDDYPHCMNMAMLFYMRADYATAESYAGLAFSIRSTINCNNLLGCIYYHLGDYDKALSHFHDVSAKLPIGNVSVLCNVAYCYKQKKSYRMATRYLEKARDMDSGDKRIYFAMGDVCLDDGDRKSAVAHFEAALAIDADYDAPKKAIASIMNSI